MKNLRLLADFSHALRARKKLRPDVAVFSILNNFFKRLRAYFSIKAVQALGSTAVSSDHSVMGLAKASSCAVIKSEAFAKRLKGKDNKKLEEKLISQIGKDAIKKIFGID